MKFKYLLTAGSITASLLLISTMVFAGATQPAEVTVTMNADDSGSASGDLVSARFADDDVTALGCGTRLLDGGDGDDTTYGFCQATDASGVRGFCFTMDSEKMSVIDNISAFSYISFSWDENGTCTNIAVSTQSFYLPESLGSNN